MKLPLCVSALFLLGAPAAAQCHISKLLHFDSPAYIGIGDPEDFGQGIAIDGLRLVVGNPGATSGVARDGCALIYARDGLNWFQQAVIESVSYEPNFGAKVAVDGDVVAIGDGINDFWIFEKVGSAWVLGADYAAPNNFQQLGRSVAVCGLRVIAGGAVNPNGFVRVYEKQGGNWVEADTIAPGVNDKFGASVALEGDRAVIGAPDADGPLGESRVGAVAIYEFDGLNWNQVDYLQPSVYTAFDNFGWDVALSGDTIAVGMPFSEESGSVAGAVFIFERVAGLWTEVDILYPADAAAGMAFGQSLDLEGTRLLAGAPLRDAGGGALGAGAGYVFDRGVSGWSETTTLVPEGREYFDEIGRDVALSGDIALLNAPGDDDEGPEYGAVHVMSVSGDLCRTLTAFPKRISLAAGGTGFMQLNAGVAHANRLYFVLGTSTNTSPGFPRKGHQIPLNIDAYFKFTFNSANSAFFVNTLGTLDGVGRANAQVVIPPASDPSLAGLKLHHVFVVFENLVKGGIRHVSNPVLFRIDP